MDTHLSHIEGDSATEIDYCHILNKVLPAEVRVLAWCPVDSDFSARFSCKQRTYKYYFPKGQLNVEVGHMCVVSMYSWSELLCG